MGELYCKWISEDFPTVDNTSWEIEVSSELDHEDNLKLQNPEFFSCYKHPLLAVLFKKRHGFGNCEKLYEVLLEGKIVDGMHKCGATKLTLLKELEIPEVTIEQKVAFGILCALEACKDSRFVTWADKWLSGEDRSVKSANVAYYACASVYSAVCNDSYPADKDAVWAACCACNAAACFYDSDANHNDDVVMDLVSTVAAILKGKRNKVKFDVVSVAKEAMEVN